MPGKGWQLRYLGGKRRIAKPIIEQILTRCGTGNGRYYEPFVGGGAVAAKIGGKFDHAFYSDYSPDLILMWSALMDGWTPPDVVTVDEYKALRNAEPSALRGFVGFGGSFGGKWFGGYARGGFNSNGSPRNHQSESKRAVLKDIQGMAAGVSTTFTHSDFSDVDPLPGSVVYCDPPYQGTTAYTGVDEFDTERFWTVMDKWSESGVHVFVSSYTAPDHWPMIWEQPLRSSARIGSEERHMATERLFYRSPN